MKSIILRSKKRILSSRHGLFRSQSQEGLEFDELVEYDYQSDAKKIDWHSFARTGKLYQKRFVNEQARQILIAPILTGSLLFGYERLLSHKVLEVVSLLSFSALLGKDQLHLAPIIEDRAHLYHPKNFLDLEQRLQEISKITLLGKAFRFDCATFFAYPKSMIIFVGDFLYEPDLALLATKHDVVCIVLRQSLIPFSQPLEMVDNITLHKRGLTLGHKAIRHYTSKRQAHHQTLFQKWRQAGIDYTVIEDEPIFQKLQLFFGRR
ncbi:MAG: hypothetical protein C6H99_03845 [Epsilonproteobacteria bacterium]|nr:hypothetical protein [Campylobacterota bacterium]NPA64941.1 DUF58 domain-containing protein [Campylobacterota bacterium]